MFEWLQQRWVSARLQRRRAFIDRLRDQGMRIGKSVVIMNGVVFDGAYPWLIEIEDGCRISADVRILAHDATPFRDLGVTRLGRVRLLRDTFIGERAIILPGVTIGPRSMVAAGSLVSRDVGPGVLVSGNPARVYGQYDDYLARITAEARESKLVAYDDLDRGVVARSDVTEAMDRGQHVYVHDAPDDVQFYHNATRDEIQAEARVAFEKHFRHLR
jgi:acetyltransferase-like isoleucine patch superfamily enzyme